MVKIFEVWLPSTNAPTCCLGTVMDHPFLCLNYCATHWSHPLPWTMVRTSNSLVIPVPINYKHIHRFSCSYRWGINGQVECVCPSWWHTPHFQPRLTFGILAPPPRGWPSVTPIILCNLGLLFGFNAGGSWIASQCFLSACVDLISW